MKRNKPAANPSRLVKINEWHVRGWITDEERDLLRKEALRTNVYTGKEKPNETLHTENNDNKTHE